MRALLFFLLAITLGEADTLRYPSLNAEGLRNLQSVKEQLLKSCPPSTCLIVFIGRSNVIISAFLTAKGIRNHVSLPGTGIRGIPKEKLKAAKANYRVSVLENLLEPQLNGRKKIHVVDFVNSGKSLVIGAQWIQAYAKGIGLHEISAAYYGTIDRKYSKVLEQSGIKHEYIYAGGSKQEGSLMYLTKDSQTEHYAPYVAWDPSNSTEKPIIDPSTRRHYPYREADGSTKYSHFASYNDLITLFEHDDPLTFLPKIHSCRAGLLGGGDLL
ncbi:MAG: hypothetical protein R3A80_11505 [Bdellovibrionota bacterium]